jgi:glycosyltransferase involved in cell wall biosynthesis
MGDDILYIVMPAYNEQDNIDSVIAQWYPVVEKVGSDSRLLIVNDGSRDNTYKRLIELEKQHPQLIAIDKSNSGHGATCLFAYRKAINENADYIFQTDSDGQTDPDEFWKFWENRKNYDFQIGDRIARDDGKDRILVTRVLRLVVRLIFGENVKDANTPFRLMKSERLDTILEVVPDDFFLSNVIISTVAVKWKERYIWRPITFKPRQAGVNSINFKRIIKIGWKALGDFRKIKANIKNKTN